MTTHTGWARLAGGWLAVAKGPTAERCYRALLDWIKAQARPPTASAVLPCGVHPGSPGEHSGLRAG
jgi:hypothetical protein